MARGLLPTRLACALLLPTWAACALLLPAGIARGQEPSLADDLLDARLWRHFDLELQGFAELPYTVVEDGRGTPWAVLPTGVAYYDGLRWIQLEQVTWDDRTQLNRLALADRGLLLVVGGRALRVDESGARELDAPGRITGAARLEDGAWELQILERDPSGNLVAALLRAGADGEELARQDPPAPLVPSSHGLWRSRSGARWINTTAGLWVDRGDGWRLHLPGPPGEYLDVVAHDEAPSGRGALVVRHPVGDRGLWTWGPEGGFTHHPAERHGRIRALAVLDDGRVLVSMESDRAAIVEGEDWQELAPGSPVSTARQLFVGHDGRLWTIGPLGIRLYWPRYGLWRLLPGTGGGLAGSINEILPRQDGSLWLATADGLRVVHADGRIETTRTIDDRTLGTVTGLAEDLHGHIWISSGSSFRGAWRWDGSSWRHFDAPTPSRAGHFHRIVRDDVGRLWLLGLRYTGYMLTDGPGVGVWIVDENGLRRWEEDSRLPNRQVYGFAQGPDGTLWFATLGGLARRREGQWAVWTEDDGLLTNRIFDVAVGGDGLAYFTDTAFGLGVVGEDDSIRYLEERHGLPFRGIWRLLPDGDRLWLGGDGGVGLYRQGRFAAVALAGVLASQRVWPLALRDGELLAGTQGRGVARLQAEGLLDRPPLVRMDTPLTDRRAARVDWNVFYPWEVVPGREIRTRHRLDDGPWSDWSTSRSARLSEIGPGEHVLAVETTGLLGTSGNAVSVPFRMPRPLARNPLFYGSVGLLLIALAVVGGVSWRRRVEQEEELRRSELRYRSLFVNANDIIFTADLDGRVLSVNPAGLEALGYTTTDIAGRTVRDVLAPEYQSLAAEMTRRKLRGRAATVYEAELVARDGSRLPVELNTQLVVEKDRVVGIQGFARDIRERRRAERTLRNIAVGVSADTGDDFFRSVAESLATELGMDLAMIGVLEPDPDAPETRRRVRTLVFWSNGEIRDNVTYELHGTPCEDVVSGAPCIHTEGVCERFPDDRTLRQEGIESYAGTPLLDSDGAPMGVMSLMARHPLRDERLARSMLQIFAIRAAAEIEKMRTAEALQRTEEELLQAQKMEAIGRLAGGIAHDFNNLLTVVTGHAELLLADLPADDRRRDDLSQILTAAHSAARLTEQLLALSRRQAVERVPVQPNEAIRGLEPLLRRLLRPDDELVVELDDRVGGIAVGAGHVEQILMNLVVNAVDAMPEGGRIFVRTRHVAGGVHGHGRRQVVLEVEDQGTGMDPDTLERVFEPFFTTKAPGHGTGLGLSTVYGIVQQSDGDISISSEPGRGTRIRMTWEAIDSDELTALEHESDVGGARGRERVLVVEDEDMVRRFVHRSLERLGYRVVSVDSGQEALSLVGGDGDETFDLLLSDVIMPGMDGVGLARRVRELAPRIRVLLMSGYTDAERLAGTDAPRCLQKPFTTQELARRVRAALDGSP